MTCEEIQKWMEDANDNVHYTVLRERDANSLTRHVLEEKHEIGRGWEIQSPPWYGGVRSYLLPSTFILNGFVKIDKQEIDKLDAEMYDSRTYANRIACKVGMSMAQKEDAQLEKLLKHTNCAVEDVTTPSTLGTKNIKLACGVGSDAAYMILSSDTVDTMNLYPSEESLVSAMQLSEVVTRENLKPANDLKSSCLLGSIHVPNLLQGNVCVLHQRSALHANGSAILKPNQKLVLDKDAGMVYSGVPEFVVTKVWDDLYVHYRYEYAYTCMIGKFHMIVNN